MRLRSLIPAVGLLLAVALSSCTSDGEAASSSSPPAASKDVAELSSALRTGVADVSSAHFVLTGTVSGQPLTGSGDQRIDDGMLTGLQAQATLPAGIGAVSIVVDGEKRYVKLPPALASGSKPWVQVTSDSSNIVVKQLAGVLDAALAAADLGGLADVTNAAKSVRKVGSEPVGGVPATRYELAVDPAKLPGDLATSAGFGTKDIPVTLWADAQNRPVQVKATVPVAGQPVAVTVTFSKFGDPVTITPPPPGQIATD